MLEFSSMAQDFVEATSSLVGGRTINIMTGKVLLSPPRNRNASVPSTRRG